MHASKASGLNFHWWGAVTPQPLRWWQKSHGAWSKFIKGYSKKSICCVNESFNANMLVKKYKNKTNTHIWYKILILFSRSYLYSRMKENFFTIKDKIRYNYWVLETFYVFSLFVFISWAINPLTLLDISHFFLTSLSTLHNLYKHISIF